MATVTAGGEALSLRVHRRDLSAPEKLPGWLGTTVMLYFNLYINIQCTTSNEGCSLDDFISMGTILEEIVAEVEEEYPSYKEEFIDTKVCPVPTTFGENVTSTERANETTNSTRRALHASEFHRRLGSYQYTSSGRCRACKDDSNDRRLLSGSRTRGLAATDAQAARDAQKKACDSADTAIVAASVAQHGSEICDKLVTDVEKLAEGYNDADVAESYEQEVTAMKQNCKDFAYTAMQAAEQATRWCSLAENAGLVPGEKNLKEVDRCAREADKFSKDAIAAAEKIHAEYDIMMEKAVEFKTLILQNNFKMQKEELEGILAAEEENTNIMEDEMTSQIKLVEDQLLLTQDDTTQAELEEKRQMLLQMKKEKAAKAVQMEKESQNMKKMYEEQLDHQIQEATILLEMVGASDVSDWLRKFGDGLEQTVPGRLLECYNTNLKAGCLEGEPKVHVRIDEKETWAGTIKGKCKIPPKS
jgi:hypothetical protein